MIWALLRIEIYHPARQSLLVIGGGHPISIRIVIPIRISRMSSWETCAPVLDRNAYYLGTLAGGQAQLVGDSRGQ